MDMELKVLNLINGLSSTMAQTSLKEYVQNREQAYENYGKLVGLVEKIKVTNIQEYGEAMEVKSLLSSLSCYVFNNRKEDWEKYLELEGQLGAKMYRFARNYGKASPMIRPLIKYLCWNRHYIDDNSLKIAEIMLQNRHLRKDGNGNYLVTGPHLAVGDNTFTYDSKGRLFRHYVKISAMQAFYVNCYWGEEFGILEAGNLIAVPLIDERLYEKVSIAANCKSCAKISMSAKDIGIVSNIGRE